MRCLVGVDDTDSPKGYCTTYLAYRIAFDLSPAVKVLPYPRLVRLNPNIPFKTRGNAAVCLQVEVRDPEKAFEQVSSKVVELADVRGGANSGLVFLEDPDLATTLEPVYLDALSGLVSPHRVRRLLKGLPARTFELGNGMGLVGAASSLAFDERFDHTYEFISYRRMENWGSIRLIDSSSVKEMDRATFPHTFNNYDHQKRKILISPHGPDPVFAGVRGDSPGIVLRAFESLRYGEELEGGMVFLSNQHTDAHLQRKLDWKVFSSGWVDGAVAEVETGAGGHVYVTLQADGRMRRAAAYEPTGDLRRAARLLEEGDEVRAYGGVRKGTSLHPKILNMERLDVMSSRTLPAGTYLASPRANRHLTKPLTRYGRESYSNSNEVAGWLNLNPTRPRALVGSPRRGPPGLRCPPRP
jgi:tRNA(Ile2)-agmatinylcytidine synthase